MASTEKNSFDLLRLVAATLVLFSHQFALLGEFEPSFLGLTTFGGAGVTIFFFLSGMLVWSSWDRDPDIGRFLARRSLRIFPALWVLVLLSVFIVGPAVSLLGLSEYFATTETWRYLSTAVMVIRHKLPGVFGDNPYPFVVNGSLWTLPVEFLCYATVATVGSLKFASKGLIIAAKLLFLVMLASYLPTFTGARFSPHFEMMAVFWWGVLYAHCRHQSWKVLLAHKLTCVLTGAALVSFVFFGSRGLERTAMMLFAAGMVYLASTVATGSKLTEPIGDLSYGVYIFAFPVQQSFVQWGKLQNLGIGAHFALSLLLTGGLAYVSWHLIEKQALRFKPSAKALQ